ncbi:hypothetical protein [Arthrobacter sp. B1805]|uniref:hypothetical protein n=1 Tax=Arthrobacter sp. B1805 TaxID=2058892 RepID=UPI000CE3D337|nr:hypothetical protein [Arthrobacter sp. B1805]
MESWKSAQRVQERRLWSTLSAVGAVLTLTLVSSILLVATSGGSHVTGWFYFQQAALLALSVAGTVAALRRWLATRARG